MNPITYPGVLSIVLGVIHDMAKAENQPTNDVLEQAENPELPVSVREDEIATAENQHTLNNNVKFGH